MLLLTWGIRYLWVSLPIITGYSAKMACSCTFLSGRPLSAVEKEELGTGPLAWATLRLDSSDQSVTATVFGLAAKKAIYRKGLGCTLVNGIPESAIRAQAGNFSSATLPPADSLPWPMGDRLSDTFPEGIDRTRLMAAINTAFLEPDTTRLLRTRAVVIVYKGQLVGEQYAPGFDRHTPQLSWSMAKSVTSALVGKLVMEGKLQPDQPAPVPEWQSVKDGREAITLKNLLHQSSGLDFEENYAKSSDATNMLFREADMGGYTAGHALREKPGTRFYYSSGNSNIIAGIVRRTIGDAAYHSYPADSLFYPAGIRSMVLEPDANGTYVGSSYAFANARDWARFGLLYANDGMAGGHRLLPEGWVKATVTPAPAAPRGQYGYQFWLNAGPAGNSAARLYPQLPEDMYYADGYEGQYVIVIPSRQLVLVRLGQTNGDNFDLVAFVGGVLGALK
ncbi:putative hydrolase [Flavihumibacter petaseus NBRC 106054]|uniref:Putative hydrolase n=1 Tax=Flavihumibacter petaseus NBRC 106054 TaxID=1220578 RepID=A0A0E9N0T8_9BACT|nr:putative hydrolase [Flavihumibacter petaseus NBRC 106054]